MIQFAGITGIEISLLLLVFLSLAVGVISGFIGTGGGFLMTPALIILGFPATFAVGTSMAWVMGNSIIGTLRHRQMGNVDVKLGLVLMIFIIGGVEIGVRALTRVKNAGLADIGVLSVSIAVLLLICGYMFYESSRAGKQGDGPFGRVSDPLALMHRVQGIKLPPMVHFARSGVTISLWILVGIGTVTGVLAGFIGVGGGIVMVPAMIYIIGVPSFLAVGTGLFQFMFSAAFGTVRYTMSGNIIIFAVFIMLLGSSIGVQFGALATKYLREISMRYMFASSIFIAVLGSALKLISLLSGNTAAWLDYGVTAVTFGGLGLIILIFAGLFVLALRHRRNKLIPAWAKSLVRC